MTDKQTLFNYRIRQAEETISDAKKMLENQLSPRSIINRTYYSMFYAVLALFIKTDTTIRTSKHSGVISIFDKEFVHTGRLGPHYSKILPSAVKPQPVCYGIVFWDNRILAQKCKKRWAIA